MKEKYNRLVIFTGHYPNNTGESFLEEEMKIAENFFKSILIVTSAKEETQNQYYVPHNAKIISLRKEHDSICQTIKVIIQLLDVKNVKELFSAIHEYGIRKIDSVFYTLLACLKLENLLSKSENLWKNDEATVYYTYWLDGSTSYLAKNKEKLNGKLIARTHGGDCFYNRGYHPFRRLVLNKCDNIFPISELGKRDIIDHYSEIDGLEKKIIVNRLGVKIPNEIIEKKKQTKYSIIVTCAEVIRIKRLDIIVDALSLEERLIHWIHFGDGADMRSFKDYVSKKLDGNPLISYEIKGRIPQKDIMEFYSQNYVDVVVNSSDDEGIPVSLMEAMSYGIPVIARDVGGNKELVDNSCGVLLPQFISPKELKNAINSILDLDEKKREIMVKNAREKIQKQFSSIINANNLFDLIQGIDNAEK